MQVNQSFGAQYNHNQDNVQNSRQFNRKQTQQYKQYYKSPSRTQYQARYPASFGIQREPNNRIKVSVSPPQNNNQEERSNTFVRNKSPGVSQISASMGTYTQQQFAREFISPLRNQQDVRQENLISSPYINNNRYNGLGTPNYGIGSPSYSNNMSKETINYSNNNISAFMNSGQYKYSQQGRQSSPKYSPQSYVLTNERSSMIEMQKIVQQLKLSLQQSLSSQQSLQQQLNRQKARSFEFAEMKRKLQQELSRMEFELERITSGDLLGQRQLMIKYQNQVKQNQRLNGQCNQVRQQLKKLRKQHREVMTENNQLKQQLQLLQTDNSQLVGKLQELTAHFNQIEKQLSQSMVNEGKLRQQNQRLNQLREKYQQVSYTNSQHPVDQQLVDNSNAQFVYNSIKSDYSIIRSQQSINGHFSSQNIQANNYVPSMTNIHNINTTRSNNNTQNNNINNNFNIKKLTNQQSPIYPIQNQNKYQTEEINYDYENSKLLEDYNKLMSQNESMKKLYQEFYQQQNLVSGWKSKNTNQYDRLLMNSRNSPHHQQHYSINQEDEELEQTRHNNFYQHYNQNQQYQQSYQEQQQSSQPLRTFQKEQLQAQVNLFRQQIIHQLITNYYTQSISQAQQLKSNVLILFIKTINKNLSTIEKMVVNYLHLRDIMKKELQKLNMQQNQNKKINCSKYQKQAEQLWLSTKQKLKIQLKAHSLPNNNTLNNTEVITLNINAYYLALFRLLTLIYKYENKTIPSQSTTLNNIKHQSLKYIHKIYQETQKMHLKSSQNK